MSQTASNVTYKPKVKKSTWFILILCIICAAVVMSTSRNVWDSFFDSLLPAEEPEVFMFNSGLVPVEIDGEWGYADKKGKIVIQPAYDSAESFEGKYAIVEKDKKFGFINKRGKVVIEPQFDVAEEFSEGLALVQKGGL